MERNSQSGSTAAPKQGGVATVPKAGIAATLIVGVLYFAFIVGAPLAPAFFAQPISDGGILSVGMVLGIILILIIVALAAIYTISRDADGRI